MSAAAASGCSATASTIARRRRPSGTSTACSHERTDIAFAELVAATNYSFLRGASHPADMVAQAIALGHKAIGIADRNTVAGVVRAYKALEDAREQAAPLGPRSISA